MSDELEIVRFALALHLGIDPASIDEAQLLDEQLGLDPLDLVLVALRLEELGEREFPVADLAHTLTVGDLAAVVRSWSRAEAATLAPPARTESGVHVAVAAPLHRTG